MADAPKSGWDSLEGFAFDADQILEFIAGAPTCVFIRLRRDGHPIGTVVGHRVIDGQIYTSTIRPRTLPICGPFSS